MAQQKPDPDPSEYIAPLNMNGLQGRMLRLPSSRPSMNRELLIVYGHHAKLERWWGVAQNFAMYGNVTMPDLPGFGGMDSFYKIGQRPTLDNLADYLASFIKLRYKRRRLTIVGISFGFVVATRMLQRYPELAKKVELAISCVGFARYDDFTFSKRRMFMYRMLARTIGLPVVSSVFRMVALNPFTLRHAYTRTHNARHKFEAAASDSLDTFNMVLDAEIELWRINDLRTHMFTTKEFLYLDNCTKQVDVPVWHVYATGDYYFNNTVVEQHLGVIFKSCKTFSLDVRTHAPSVVATKKEAAKFMPPKFRRALARLPH